MKTKKYKNFGSLMFVNSFTLEKIQKYEIDIIKLRLKLKTLKDFKIVIREELENNEVYFYVERLKEGEIIKCSIEDILK